MNDVSFLEMMGRYAADKHLRPKSVSTYTAVVVVKYFWPLSFEHSSTSFLPYSAAVHRYACAA